MKTVKITISKGQTKIETSGFSGSACQDATKKLEAALGQTLTDTPTEEMYNENSSTQDQ